MQDRTPFEVTLLLPAGLHRAVLSGDARAAELVRYYPTAGGTAPSVADSQFSSALLNAIRDLRNPLEVFLRNATVQTNETARGLVWLWPLAQTGWPSVELLELGASAGLNLLADHRAYRLLDAEHPEQPLLDLGNGDPVQFVVEGTGTAHVTNQTAAIPRIASRVGVDLNPFQLPTAAEELTLASFVWGDQPVRLTRLREGIAALRTADVAGHSPQLEALSLPDQLTMFLDGRAYGSKALPLVIYNTAVSMYLAGRQEGLRRVIERWSAAQSVPVLWIQWEPGSVDKGSPPHKGWYAWTIDLWQDARHEHVHLAWIHPHASGLLWLPGAREWIRMAVLLR